MIGLLLFVGLGFSNEAQALLTSENSLRIEANSGNLVLGSEHAEIESGEVYESVVLLWGNLHVHGQVKDILVVSGKVHIHPTGKVKEKMVITGGEFELLPGAEVRSDQILYRSPGPIWNVLVSVAKGWQENIGTFLWIGLLLFLNIFHFLCGSIFFRFSSTFRGILVGRLGTQWLQNIGAAILGIVCLPMAIGLFVVSIVGILLLPLFFLVLVISFLFAYWGAALWVGQRIFPPRRNQPMSYWGYILGLTVLQILWWIGYWPGYLVIWLVFLLAWGSLLRSIPMLWK